MYGTTGSPTLYQVGGSSLNNVEINKVDDAAARKLIDVIAPALRGLLAEHDDWSSEALDKFVADLCEQRGVGMGKVAQPVRVAVTGRAVSPQLGETLALLGKDKTLARIDRCLAARQ